MQNYFIFDGLDSRDYGIWLFDMSTDTGAELQQERVAVPGRDGDLTIGSSRLANVTHRYMGVIYQNFESNLQAFRDAMAAKRGYLDLTDSFHPDENYKALYSTAFDPTIPHGRGMGKFAIEFDRKPQRWLASGQNAITIGSWEGVPTVTVEGDPAQFTADESTGIKSLSAKINAVQAGSGDPSPDNVRLISGWSTANIYIGAQEGEAEHSYPVAFGEAGTVYGGTLDVLTGVLTVDRALTTINDLTWSRNNAREIFYATVEEPGMEKDNLIGTPIMCDSLPYKGIADSVVHAVQAIGDSGVASSVNTTHPYIYLRHNDISTQSDLKAALGTAQIVYQLATPQTYQLTPQAVKTLVGANNVWADTGAVTVEYGEAPNILVNPTAQKAKPLIHVVGYGTLYVGSHAVTISQGYAYVDIDCDMMDCFHGTDNANALVSFANGDFPTLAPGTNGITYSGNITEVSITPRWWRR